MLFSNQAPRFIGHFYCPALEYAALKCSGVSIFGCLLCVDIHAECVCVCVCVVCVCVGGCV